MKGVLYYFSGTGNTRWAAERFRDYFKLYGADVGLVNIEKDPPEEQEYDFVLIGTPIYFGQVPRIVKHFIEAMPEAQEDKKCILFSTNSGRSSGILDMFSPMIKGKGYNIISQVNIIMPSDFNFDSSKVFDNDDIIEGKASAKIKAIVKDFVMDKHIIEKASKVTILFKKFVSVINSSKRMRMVKYLDCTTECIKCGLCLRNCPCGNITLNNGRVVFHSNCIMCMRCIYICPKKAITYRGLKLKGHSGINLGKLDII